MDSQDEGQVATGQPNHEQNQVPYLDYDTMDTIIRLTVHSFLYMRHILSRVSRYFKDTVRKCPCPIIYLRQIGPTVPTTMGVMPIIRLVGKGSGAVMRLREILNCPRWHHARLNLVPEPYGWYAIVAIFWK